MVLCFGLTFCLWEHAKDLMCSNSSNANNSSGSTSSAGEGSSTEHGTVVFTQQEIPLFASWTTDVTLKRKPAHSVQYSQHWNVQLHHTHPAVLHGILPLRYRRFTALLFLISERRRRTAAASLVFHSAGSRFKASANTARPGDASQNVPTISLRASRRRVQWFTAARNPIL